MSRQPLAPRRDFPALASSDVVYLDNAATTQKPQVVIDAMSRFYGKGCANVDRGLHAWAERTNADYAVSRIKIAASVGADPDQLIFTSGTTEALNLVARGWLLPRLQPEDRLVCTPLEHHANWLPWQELARQRGAHFAVLSMDAHGVLDLGDAAAKLAGATLFAVCARSNVLGLRPPLEELLTLARDAGVCTVVDAAQAVAHERLNFKALGCDFLAFSGHKMFGPMGIGALVGRLERLTEMEPQRLGGGMLVDLGEGGIARWRDVPARLEGGTPNVAGAVGLAAAIDYIDDLGLDRIADHEAALIHQLAHGLDALGAKRLRVIRPGCKDASSSLVSFTLAPHHPHDVAQLLDQRGIAVRAGLHCAQALHRRLGHAASIRVSVAPYNGSDDIEALLLGLHYVLEVLG